MPFFLVMPLDEAEWALEPDLIATRMGERWPDAELRLVENQELSSEIDFEIPLGSYLLSGWIMRDGRSLHLDGGEPEQMAEVAVWFQQQVPMERPLLFLDEGNAGCVRIEPWTTPSQLASAYLAADGWAVEPGFAATPPSHSDWALAPSAFGDRMRERWPNATVTLEEHDADPLLSGVTFGLSASGGDLTGWFAGGGRYLYMEAVKLEQRAQLALWFRELVPSEQPLDFLGLGPDEGRIALKHGMTVEHLVAAYRASVA